MTILYIPLHLPMKGTQHLLWAELQHREVRSVKVTDGFMVIEHERKSDVCPITVTCGGDSQLAEYRRLFSGDEPTREGSGGILL